MLRARDAPLGGRRGEHGEPRRRDRPHERVQRVGGRSAGRRQTDEVAGRGDEGGRGVEYGRGEWVEDDGGSRGRSAVLSLLLLGDHAICRQLDCGRLRRGFALEEADEQLREGLRGNSTRVGVDRRGH